MVTGKRPPTMPTVYHSALRRGPLISSEEPPLHTSRQDTVTTQDAGAWALVIWYQQYQHFSFNHRCQQVPLKLHPLLHEPLIMKFMRAVLLTARKDKLWNQYFCDVHIGGTNSILYMKVKVKSLSHVRLFATSRTVAYQAPLSMGFSRQEYWSGLPLPSPGDLLNQGIEPGSPALQADTLTSEPPRKPILVHTEAKLQPFQSPQSH